MSSSAVHHCPKRSEVSLVLPPASFQLMQKQMALYVIWGLGMTIWRHAKNYQDKHFRHFNPQTVRQTPFCCHRLVTVTNTSAASKVVSTISRVGIVKSHVEPKMLICYWHVEWVWFDTLIIQILEAWSRDFFATDQWRERSAIDTTDFLFWDHATVLFLAATWKDHIFPLDAERDCPLRGVSPIFPLLWRSATFHGGPRVL